MAWNSYWSTRLVPKWLLHLSDGLGTEEKNVVAANEGNAIAIAAGYFLSTGRVALVYMQTLVAMP